MPLLDKLLSLTAPHDCLVCGVEGTLVCDWCAPDAFLEVPSRCYRCHSMTSDYAVCNKCSKQTSLKHVWVRTGYENTAKELMRLYKYQRARAAQSIIADAMNEVLPHLAKDTLVIAVPTATSRVRKRGYDQAALLASNIAWTRKLIYMRGITRLTQSRQVGASRKIRLTQLEGAFMVARPAMINGADVLLVDDVITTGATLEIAACTLKQAGVKTVSAIVFAQKQ